MVISDEIPPVPRNKKSRNSVPNPSVEEKKARNCVPWNKNRSKLSKLSNYLMLMYLEDEAQLLPLDVDAQEDLGAGLLGKIRDENVELAPHVGGHHVADEGEVVAAGLLHLVDRFQDVVQLVDVSLGFLVPLPNRGGETGYWSSVRGVRGMQGCEIRAWTKYL